MNFEKSIFEYRIEKGAPLLVAHRGVCGANIPCNSLAAYKTDFFDVAVSCAGNHDNNIYNRWWSEKHHGISEVEKDGETVFEYHISANHELAERLKGHLLLVHGDIDENVHPGCTLRVVDALIRANKRFDMLLLPGQRHGFGDMNEYFFWRMADYFSEHLLGSKETSTDIPQLNNDL